MKSALGKRQSRETGFQLGKQGNKRLISQLYLRLFPEKFPGLVMPVNVQLLMPSQHKRLIYQ